MKKVYLTLIVFSTFLSTIHNTHADEPGMVLIPAGEFNIGKLTTAVHLEDYYIDKTEVTQKDFKKVMGSTNFFFKSDNHPAEQITWYKANEYCETIGKRLPSELEWEKAAKAGTTTNYFWGMKPNADYGWYGGDYDLGHHPVGKKKPNNFGLQDTSGNVWEWTSTKGETKVSFQEKS